MGSSTLASVSIAAKTLRRRFIDKRQLSKPRKGPSSAWLLGAGYLSCSQTVVRSHISQMFAHNASARLFFSGSAKLRGAPRPNNMATSDRIHSISRYEGGGTAPRSATQTDQHLGDIMAFRHRKKLIALAALGTTTLIHNAHADTTVKIGHIAPLTGGLAHQGKDLENGARLAVDEINKSGLVVAGQKVTLVLDSQDDAGDPRQGTQAAQRLIDDGVVAVVGHLNSGVNIPASKLYNDAGVTNITPAASNPALTQQGFKTEFRLVATDAQQGPALAKYALQAFKPKKVGVVDDATAYGQGLASEFAKSAQALGITVLPREVTNDKAVDFKAILTTLKSEHPDVIMFGGMDATGGPFAKQARQLAIDSKVLMGDGGCTASLPSLAGAGATSVFCSEGGTALEKMPGGPEFAKKFEERYHTPMQTYAPFSYDAVYVIVDAMKRAQSTSVSKILAAMPATDYSGVTGRIQFTSNGDLKQPVVSIYNYKNNTKTLVDIIKP